MKKFKTIAALSLVAALAVSAFVGCGKKAQDAEQDQEVKEPEVVEYLDQMANTDEYDKVLQTAASYILASDYKSLCEYDASDEVKALYSACVADKADRYIYEAEGTSVMLYATENGNLWYVGAAENGIRQGQGKTIACFSDCVNIFEGTYAKDVPAGDGVLTYAALDGKSSYTVSGKFDGTKLNGTYECALMNAQYTEDVLNTSLDFADDVLTTENDIETEEDVNVFLFAYYSDDEYIFWAKTKEMQEKGIVVLQGNGNILTK